MDKSGVVKKILISLLMLNFAYPAMGMEKEEAGITPKLAQAASAAGPRVENEEDAATASLRPSAVPQCVFPFEMPLGSHFDLTSQDTLVQKGFTCIGIERLHEASQEKDLLALWGSLPYCPWATPVSLNAEAMKILSENPMTKILGQYLLNPLSSQKAVQFFVYFPKMFESPDDPCIIMVERAFRAGDPSVEAAQIEAFFQSLQDLDGLIMSRPDRDDHLSRRVSSGDRNQFIGAEIDFLKEINLPGMALSIDALLEYQQEIAHQGYGQAYARGHGVVQNHEEALQNFTLAAEQGNAEAQCDLGFIYEHGHGVVRNQEEAIRYYTLAAKQGLAEAQHNLGFIYEQGHGVVQNHEEAIRYYTLAAEQGLAVAQYNLGSMYEKGHDVDQKHEEAVRYYTLAAEQGLAEAQCHLGVMYARGHGVVQNHEEAARYYTLAAKQGLAVAQYNLGFMYEGGIGVAHNDKEAVRYFTLAAEQGDVEAQSNLGVMYVRGRGVSQNQEKAVRCFTLAAEQGLAQAQYNLGFMYERGRGVVQNVKEATRLYTLAAEKAHAAAQKALLRISTKRRSVAQATHRSVVSQGKKAQS